MFSDADQSFRLFNEEIDLNVSKILDRGDEIFNENFLEDSFNLDLITPDTNNEEEKEDTEMNSQSTCFPDDFFKEKKPCYEEDIDLSLSQLDTSKLTAPGRKYSEEEKQTGDFAQSIRNLPFKNVFDISFLFIQGFIKEFNQSLSRLEYFRNIKQAFLRLVNATIPTVQSITQDVGHLRDANMRKRVKTFFHKVLVSLLNPLLEILMREKTVYLKNLKFYDPHKRNNRDKIYLPVGELLLQESKVNSKLMGFLWDRHKVNSFIVCEKCSETEVLAFQLIESIVNSVYGDIFEHFFTSRLYQTFYLGKISEKCGREYAASFNFYAKSFIKYITD